MMTQQEFIEKISQLRKTRKFINMKVVKKFNANVYNFMMSSTRFLPDNSNFNERFYCITNNIKQRQICPVCKKNYLKFLKIGRYQDGCCRKCSAQAPSHKRRMMQKYGHESHNSAPIVKFHQIASLMKNYGVSNSYQIPEVKRAAKEKSLQKHSVEHWTNTKRSRRTFKKKTGYENPSQDPSVKEKKAKTCLKNFGVENPSKSPEITKKKIETCLENYGVEYGYMIDRHIAYNSISSLNKRMYKILDENNIKHQKEFRIYANGTYRAYDIMIEDFKLIDELNGDFWHANPKMFKSEDLLNFPHIGKIQAQKIWEHDAQKKQLAIDNGYNIMYFWESDLKKMSDSEIVAAILKQTSFRADPL